MAIKGQDIVTGVYQCKDPVKNFKIKVKLQQDKTTLIPLPDFESRPEKNEGAEKHVEYEEKLISWQEKIFSPFEISYYSHTGNCHNPLEEKYHYEVLAFQGLKSSTRIFTYTDADNFNGNDHANSITTEINHVPSMLEQGMTGMQQRRRFGRNQNQKKYVSLANHYLVDYSPVGETKKKNHFLQSSCQTYHILADLRTKESSEKEEHMRRAEYVLCTVKYDSDSNNLFVTPDFSTVSLSGQSLPYCIEVDGDSRNVYQYWLEHASESLVEEDKEKEDAILTQFLDHQLDIRLMKVGTDFEFPPYNYIMMYVMGEIVSAEDFEYDDLFVHFLFELPRGWSCENLQQLSGVTQKCRNNGTGMAYFGHLFETPLKLKVESTPVEADSVMCWPQLFAEVLSFDTWGRFRIEGYCYVKVPSKPGQYYLALQTWRPLTRGPIGELRRFFVGGSPGLEDLSTVGVPATFEGNHLSKFGLQTTGSGILHLRLNVIHQSTSFNSDIPGMENLDKRNRTSYFLERLSATSIINSVNSVMAAFKRAHERMLRAREGLDE